jgi:hypothetical protein
MSRHGKRPALYYPNPIINIVENADGLFYFAAMILERAFMDAHDYL